MILRKYEAGSEVSTLARMAKPQDWHRTGGEPWDPILTVASAGYLCGYCGSEVASGQGWSTIPRHHAVVRVCPQCNAPTFFTPQRTQYPDALLGGRVAGLTDDVRGIYDEARHALTVGAATGTVMLCRKILMHVAVDMGADEGKKFQEYVEWLASEGWIPRGGQPWVDFIRRRGNEANHQLPHMTRDDAAGILQFTEALLRNVYELPALVPPPPDAEPQEAGG